MNVLFVYSDIYNMVFRTHFVIFFKFAKHFLFNFLTSFNFLEANMRGWDKTEYVKQLFFYIDNLSS